MTTYTRLEEIKATELRIDNARDTYYKAEAELVGLIGDYAMGAEVSCTTLGFGHIVNFYGTTLDGIIVEIEFADTVKKFSLQHILTTGQFVKFVDTLEIGIIWNEAMVVHNELTKQFKELDKLDKQLKEEAAKKAEEDRKAEEKYQKARDKALKDFEAMATRTKVTYADEFYYALGWLAKHVGSISARLPDYLSDAFKKHFGNEVPFNAVDSKKRTVNGNSMQWTFGFTATLRKPESIPAVLTEHLNSTGKQIADTSFIWDLVDNYGFQFSKKQDVEKIKACIPSEHLEFFEAGLAS